MSFVQKWCDMCNGTGTISIGREIDDEQIAEETCPACKGKKFFTIHVDWYGLPTKRLRPNGGEFPRKNNEDVEPPLA